MTATTAVIFLFIKLLRNYFPDKAKIILLLCIAYFIFIIIIVISSN